MRVEKGNYPLKKHHLRLCLSHNLELGASPTCLYLTGVNGLGKTSFIEKILIPALKEQHVPFIYLGQDFRTQLYTLKALLAVTAKENVPETVPEILTRWIGQNRHTQVCILDEFDKYPADTRHLFKISRDFIRTYIIVSHADHPVKPGDNFRTRILTFRGGDTVGPMLPVTIEETESWLS